MPLLWIRPELDLKLESNWDWTLNTVISKPKDLMPRYCCAVVIHNKKAMNTIFLCFNIIVKHLCLTASSCTEKERIVIYENPVNCELVKRVVIRTDNSMMYFTTLQEAELFVMTVRWQFVLLKWQVLRLVMMLYWWWLITLFLIRLSSFWGQYSVRYAVDRFCLNPWFITLQYMSLLLMRLLFPNYWVSDASMWLITVNIHLTSCQKSPLLNI